jgi:hypothetical protein
MQELYRTVPDLSTYIQKKNHQRHPNRVKPQEPKAVVMEYAKRIEGMGYDLLT